MKKANFDVLFAQLVNAAASCLHASVEHEQTGELAVPAFVAPTTESFSWDDEDEDDEDEDEDDDMISWPDDEDEDYEDEDEDDDF